MGKGHFSKIWVFFMPLPGVHLARAVYEAQLPPARDDFEYYLTAETVGGPELVWPATAPSVNQTVVAME